MEISTDQRKASGTTSEEKTTEAERREMQESQRGEKSTVQGECSVLEIFI